MVSLGLGECQILSERREEEKNCLLQQGIEEIRRSSIKQPSHFGITALPPFMFDRWE
jgi:hypothetical protein